MKFMISFGMLIAWLFPIILSFTLYVLSLMLLKLFMLFMSAGWIICSLQFLQDNALNSKPFFFIKFNPQISFSAEILVLNVFVFISLYFFLIRFLNIRIIIVE